MLGRKIREYNRQHLSSKSQDEREELLDCKIRRENNQHFLDIISQKSCDDVKQIIDVLRIRKKTAVVNCLERLLDECYEFIDNNLSCYK